MTRDDLQPCSKCDALSDHAEVVVWHSHHTRLACIKCFKCGKRTTTHHTTEDAVAEWNDAHAQALAARAAKRAAILGGP